jgi:hypothetical protein
MVLGKFSAKADAAYLSRAETSLQKLELLFQGAASGWRRGNPAQSRKASPPPRAPGR